MNAQDKAQNLIAKFRKAGCASFPEAEVHSAISSAKLCCDELIDQCETESDQQYWRSVKEVLAGPHFKLPTVQPSIPAHIVDDMKLDSYYDGFKDGQAMTGNTSTSGEEAGRISVKDFYNMSDQEQLNHLFPLTAQPDKQGEEPISLADLEPGSIFEHNGCYAVKSEYRTKGGAIEAIIIGSGEMFWGGTDNAEDQKKLIVKPIKLKI